MFNLDDITNENSKEHNQKWPFFINHPCRILIIGGSGSGKTNALLDLISHQDDIDKIHSHAKDLSEPKYQFLIKKREDAGVNHSNYSNYSIGFSNTMDYVYKSVDDYNANRKRRILVVFDDMIADIMSNKKFQAIIKKLFIRWRKLNTSLVLFFCSKTC